MLNRQQHVRSYYAAKVNDSTDFAPLTGSVSADVCVMGAGFIGILTALHLAERSYNVHVIATEQLSEQLVAEKIIEHVDVIVGVAPLPSAEFAQ